MLQFGQEWDDAVRLADSTPRGSLAPQIAKMQEVRRKVQAQEWPGCGQAAYGLLVKGMDQQIDGFIAFLRQEADYKTKIQDGNKTLQEFVTELQRVVR